MAKNYQRNFFRVYKNGLHGYVSTTGEVLMPPDIESDVCDITIVNIDSLVNPDYAPSYNDITSTKVLANNSKTKPYILCTNDVNFDPYTGEEILAPIFTDFTYYEKAKFGFQDNGKVRFMGPWNTEDVILLDKYFRPYLLSTFRTQYILRGMGSLDSLLDGKTKKRVKIELDLPHLTEEMYFLDHLFAKYDGKWYLQNMNGVLLNNGHPFDSVEIVGSKVYKAWIKGKFGYYDYKYKGPFEREMDREYPNQPFVERIACRDCNYKMKKYPRQTVLEQFDAEGNRIRDSIIHYTFNIPLMQKGTYNIIDTNNRPILKIWADEILLPPVNGYNFNIADSTSGVFDEKNLGKPGYPFIETHKKSIALKYGEKWRLTTLKKQDIFIDGFKEVKIEGDNWVVRKKKKFLYYSIDGLKKVKR